MKLSKTEFDLLFEGADAEQFAGTDFTLTNYDDDEFYFYYDAIQDEITDQGDYELTEIQLYKVKKVLFERYKEYLEENREETPVTDYYEHYGVSRASFL